MSLNAHLFGILFPSYVDAQSHWNETTFEAGQSSSGVEEFDLNGDGIITVDDAIILFASDWSTVQAHSPDNARLVALSDNQLVFLLSLIRSAEFPEAWHMAWGDGVAGVPTYPSQPLNDWAYGRVVAWLEDLKEQLMVDVRPELNAMVAAQNEMSDDLDAIRIAIQEIAADIEAGNNAERLEEIANTIGLLVALL